MDRANRKQIVTGQYERIRCQLDMVTDVCNLSPWERHDAR